VTTTTTATIPEAVELTAEADQALYTAKANGRDRVIHHLDQAAPVTR
jgi:PleD family two-component response regulator